MGLIVNLTTLVATAFETFETHYIVLSQNNFMSAQQLRCRLYRETSE